MRYSHNVISRTLRIAALALPLSIAAAAPAFAGAGASGPGTEPAEVASLRNQYCSSDVFTVTLVGLDVPSSVTGQVQFNSLTPTAVNESVSSGAGDAGSGTVTLNFPIAAGTTVIKLSLSYTLWDGTTITVNPAKDYIAGREYSANEYGGRMALADCPGAPQTGGDPAPIGRIALGATLGGALLAAVAVRRRPRKQTSAA